MASPSYPPSLSSSPLYVARKAKVILATHDVTEITKLVTNLCLAKETEDESSNLLCKSFKKHFPNLLAMKLLQVYRFTDSPTVRSHALSLLDSLLIDLEDSRIKLKTEALKDIKEDLNSCLVQQEISDLDFKLLSRIISCVSVYFFVDHVPWEELSLFIAPLNEKRTLLIFSELPTILDEAFFMPLMEDNLGLKIVNELFDQDLDEEEWCVALEAGFNLMVQLVNSERKDLVWDSVYVIVSSVWEMVNVRKRDDVVRKGLMRLVKKVRREALRFRGPEFEVVSRLALMIKEINGVGKDIEFAAKTIHDFIRKQIVINSA